MGGHERYLTEIAAVDAIADRCVAIRSRIAADEAAMLRELAAAWDLAQQQTARIASAASRQRDMPLRSIAAQISVETHLHDRTVQTKMHDAWRLVTLFPATVDALAGGRISKAHADVILDTGAVLEETEVRAAFESVVLDWAEAETVGRTRSYARQLAEKLDPRSMHERHAVAADDQKITIVDLDDAMSQVIALVPTIYAHAIADRLTRQAHALKRIDQDARRAAGAEGASADGDGASFDDRTIDQTRADLFIDLLLTGAPAIDATCDALPGGLGAIRAHVQITMPLTTLTGVTDGGADIDGKAPIDPTTARLLAGATPVWDRVMYDPITAVVLTVDRYQPTPAQRRLRLARDRHCRFPGCRMPARRCQIDHNHEHHDGGPTSTTNLACLCIRHHTLKTDTDWTARQLPGGRLKWTTPTGRTHTDHPPQVIFRPTLDAAPF